MDYKFYKKRLWLFSGKILGILLTFVIVNVCYAQELTVNGLVTDERAIPIFGVNVIMKGTTLGSITDLDGKFSMAVPDKSTVLLFSFIGYKPQEITVGDQTTINVVLIEEATQINEIVVVGYGVQKKKLNTGANIHVGNEEIEKMHSLRIEQALQGSSPGVQITANSGQPGDALKVRIRGVGTVGNSDPLYVVDGMPVDDIKYLSPSDIESVDVLKDAASAAIYGSRAANGVVLITTRKGKSGAMKLSFDCNYGIQNVAKKLKMLNGREYAMIMNEANTNTGSEPVFTQAEIDAIGEGTDWQDYLFRKNVPTQNYSVGISGGTEKGIYLTSMSYFKQEGIIGTDDKSSFERLTFMINSENKLYKDILKFGENLVYTHSNSRGVGVGDAYNNTVRSFLNTDPTFPVYSDTTSDGYGKSLKFPLVPNPLAALHYQYQSEDKIDKIMGNVYADLEFIKGLKFTSKLGIDVWFKRTNSFDPIYTLTEMSKVTNSKAKMSQETNFTYNFENYLSYSKTLGKHDISILLGNTVEEYKRFYVGGEKEDLIIADFEHAVINGATREETQKINGSKSERALLSYFGRLNYNYGEKYMLSATCRIDGSSKFGPESGTLLPRSGVFPSISAGWVVTGEDFFKINNLEFLKLRASWGQNGNDKILDYMYESYIVSQGLDYYFGADDIKYVGSAPLQLPNQKLKWETSEQLDFGIDSRFLNGFTLAFDWYKKTTRDWLVVAPISALAGAFPPYKNGGDVENKGIELDLGYRKTIGDLSFGISGNVSYNKNEVLKINNPDSIIHGESNTLFHGHSEFYRAQPGYPIGFFYGLKKSGIFQNQAEIDNYLAVNYKSEPILDRNGKQIKIQPIAKPGDVKWIDQNKDGKINQFDKVEIGDPNPDFTFGLSLNADYKGLDISMIWQGVAGNQIVYGMRPYERWWNNYTTEILDRWTGEGTSNSMPRVTPEPGFNYGIISDLFIKDGSYLKLRSLNIGYDLKKSLLKNTPIQRFRIYVSGTNLLTFTKYPGYDPEVGYGDYDVTKPANFSSGIDIGHYPLPRTYMVGLNINF